MRRSSALISWGAVVQEKLHLHDGHASGPVGIPQRKKAFGGSNRLLRLSKVRNVSASSCWSDWREQTPAGNKRLLCVVLVQNASGSDGLARGIRRAQKEGLATVAPGLFLESFGMLMKLSLFG